MTHIIRKTAALLFLVLVGLGTASAGNIISKATEASNGSVTAQVGGSTVTTADAGTTVTLILTGAVKSTCFHYGPKQVTITTYYNTGSADVRTRTGDNIDVQIEKQTINTFTNNTCTFTMPDGDVEIDPEFEVVLTDVTSANADIAAIDAQAYQGTALKPAPVVKVNDVTSVARTLTAGTDYDLSYADNINVGANAKVIFTFKGAYAGTVEKNFAITARSITVAAKDQNIAYGETIAEGVSQAEVSGSDGLLSGHALSSVTLTATETTVGTHNNAITPSAAKILNGGTDVTGNYNISYSNGKLTIGAKNLGDYYTADDFTLTPNAIVNGAASSAPTVTLKNGDTSLSEGTDYEVKWYNGSTVVSDITAAAAGTYTAKVVGKSPNYTGEITVSQPLTVHPASNGEVTIDGILSEYTYTSTAVIPTFAVKEGTTTLGAGTDYDYVFSDNVNAGTATLTVNLKGAYDGQVTKTFQIVPVAITVTAKDQTVSYGSDISTAADQVTVTLGTLVSGHAITGVTLTANQQTKKITAAKAVITNASNVVTDNYKITYADGTLTVNKKELTGAEMTITPSAIIIGNADKKPTVAVTVDGRQLVEDTDYEVVWTDADNNTVSDITSAPAGTYTAKVVAKADGNYSGEVTVSGQSLTVYPQNPGTVTIDDIASTEYTGSEVNPTITVKQGGTVITSGYSVSYENNTNAGTATVKLTLDGNNTGTPDAIKTFEITKKSVTVKAKNQSITSGTAIANTTDQAELSGAVSGHTISQITLTASEASVGLPGTITPSGAKIASSTDVTANYNITYTDGVLTMTAKTMDNVNVTLGAASIEYGAAIPTITVKDGETSMVEGSDFTVTWTDKTTGAAVSDIANAKPGTYTVTVTGKGNYSGSKTADLTINAKTASDLTIEGLVAAGYAYNGQLQKPAVSVKGDGKTLMPEVDYDLTYTNNVDVGTATVTATLKGHYTGTKSENFTINAKSITVTANAQVIAYGESIDNSASQVAAEGLVTGHAVSGVTLTVDAGNTTITPSAVKIMNGSTDVTANYAPTYHTGTLTVNKKSLAGAEVTFTPTAITKTATAMTAPTVTVTLDGTTVATSEYTVVWIDSENNEVADIISAAAGTYTVKIKAAESGHYSTPEAGGIAINGKPLTIYAENTASVTIEGITEASYPYTGSAVTPEFTVKEDVTTLAADKYTATFENNVNAGTATLKVKLLSSTNDYDATKTFEITKKAVTITAQAQTVTHGAQPDQSVSQVTSEGLVEGHEIALVTLTADEANQTVTPSGAKVLSGQTDVTANYDFTYVAGTLTVEKKALTGATVTVSPSAITAGDVSQVPTVTVTVDGTQLVEGTDYTMTWTDANGNAVSDITTAPAGSYKAKIEAKEDGSYSGTVTAQQQLTIYPQNAEGINIDGVEDSYTYSGGAITPDYSVKRGSKTLTSGTDYTAVIENNTNAGTATIKVTLTSSASVSATKTFQIIQKAMSITAKDQTVAYGDPAQQDAEQYTVMGLIEGQTLASVTLSVDESAKTVTPADAVVKNAGGSVVTANYQVTYTAGKLTVTPKSVADLQATLASTSVTTGSSAPAVTVKNGRGENLTAGVDYSVEWKDAEGNVVDDIASAPVGTYTAVIKGNGNYTGEQTLTQKLTVNNPAPPVYYYSINIQQPQHGSITINGMNNVVSTSSAAGETITVSATADEGYYVESITVNGTPIEGSSFTMPNEDVTVTAVIKVKAPKTGDEVPVTDSNSGTQISGKVTGSETDSETGKTIYDLTLTGLPESVLNGTTSLDDDDMKIEYQGNTYQVKEVDASAFEGQTPGVIIFLPDGVSTTAPVTNVVNGDGTSPELNLNNVTSFVAPKTVHADKVTYQRSTAAGFFTLCLPYDLELPEGYTAWTLKKGIDGVAEFQAGGREVKAGEPYVVGVDDADKSRKVTRAGASIDLSAENVTIAATTSDESVLRDDVEMFGTIAGLSLTKGAELKALVIQPDFSWKMAPMTSEMYVPAFECYLVVKGDMASTIAEGGSIPSSFGDATGIWGIKTDGLDDGDWYNLDGSKLEGKPRAKGMYIHNGRKVVVK